MLFDIEADPKKNLLPSDGIVHYFGKVFEQSKADNLYESLLKTIEWQHDEARIFGKHIVTKRKVAWYADTNYSYHYSGTIKVALPWTEGLKTVKEQVESLTDQRYNSCLLNLYHSGEEGMAWHRDEEKELKPNGSIASLSFGAERKFSFKHRVSKERIDTWLEHGSLLEMKGTTQTHWLHRLPPTKKVATPRINLTFRQMNK